MECVIVQDLFLNETANYAQVFLPGSTFLEKDGTFTNAERRINRVRKVMQPRNGYADWEVTMLLANAMGAGWTYTHPSQVMDEIAATTPTFAGVSYELLRRRARSSGPATSCTPRARPSCTSRASCAARGASSSPSTSRPTRRPAPASRSSSPQAASVAVQRGRPDAAHTRSTSGIRRRAGRSTPRRRGARHQGRRPGPPRLPRGRDLAAARF
jgi:NADH dehydrogenase/NADH:ubiquinone oxidoreductase subunit G